MTCRIHCFGSELDQLVGIWTSVPAGTLSAVPTGDGTLEEILLDIQVPADAPLGIYGLRLATRSGLSNVHLFLIDELPVTARESLATDPQGVAQAPLPACITAVCREAAVDRYAIEVHAGQCVAFEVIGNRFGKDYDPLLVIRDAQGRLLAERDNDPGLLFDCRFEHTFAAAGRYLVEVRDARFLGQPTWHYVLRMGDFPSARVALPSAVRPGQKSPLSFPQVPGLHVDVDIDATAQRGTFFQELRPPANSVATWIPLLVSDLENAVEIEPNGTRETATPVTVPANLHGVLTVPGEQDWFSFKLAKGQSLHLQGAASVLGSPVDLELALFDKTGRELKRIDDVLLEEGAFDFSAGEEGEYFLLVRDIARDGGPAFAYRIEVQPGAARLQFTSEVSALTLPQGTYQPIPLTITRTGFQGPIELSLLGAPAGVTLEATTIPADVNEFVCKLSAGESAVPGVSTIQIVGRAKAGDTAVECVARTQPLIDRQLQNVDLIIYALREEQRRLPPSLINRIALQVTPPAPYSIDLPEQLVLLPRFQDATFPVTAKRAAGFEGPLVFEAKGGQIGPESEFRRQVYGRFPNALPGQPSVGLKLYTRNLTQLAKHRVDVTATGVHDGRTIRLTRTFTLDIRSTFEPVVEAIQAATPPGGTLKLKVRANRVPTFDGAVIITSLPTAGFALPATVEIPSGQPGTDFEVKIAADAKPGKYRLRFTASGFVDKSEESLNVPEFEIEVTPLATKS